MESSDVVLSGEGRRMVRNEKAGGHVLWTYGCGGWVEEEARRCACVLFGVVHGMHEALEAALRARTGWARTFWDATMQAFASFLGGASLWLYLSKTNETLFYWYWCSVNAEGY